MQREKMRRPDLGLADKQEHEPAPVERGAASGDRDAAARLSSIQHVQLHGAGGASDEQVKDAAARGLEGAGTQLPHMDSIQRAFGAGHDLSGVRAHVGGPAAEASEEMNAAAFATGREIGFRDQPTLHLAAHEAAHVVQQQAGVALSGGVGHRGDAFEHNADAVADRVVAGRSAEDLLPPPGASHGDAAIQRYEEEIVSGLEFRVSETGKSMVSQDAGGGGQTLYATEDLIAEANSKLSGAGKDGSFISLVKAGATREVKGQKLAKVMPVFTNKGVDPDNDKLTKANSGGKDDDGKKGGAMALWAQCGRSSRTVMGTDDYGDAPHAGYQDGKDSRTTSRSNNPATFSREVYLQVMPGFMRDPAHEKFLKDGTHYRGDKKNVINPTTADQARTQYWELGEEGRAVFDQKVGINTGANPEIGGAYTLATEYDMPGFKEVNKDFTWNFHWAGVIMKDGENNITLENYAIMFEPTGDAKKDAENREKAYDWANRDWVYQMYGLKKKTQTFQEQHLATGTHGTRGSTFAAKVD